MNSAIDHLRSDVAFALRQFARQPRFFAVVALTLIVGIAASTSIFAVVDGVLLRPLPYPDSTRLVRLDTNSFRGEYYYLREQAMTMDVAAYYPAPMEVTVNLGDEPVRATGRRESRPTSSTSSACVRRSAGDSPQRKCSPTGPAS